MCIGEAPPFRVDAKLVLSTASTKTHRYRRVAKETAMISAHRDSNCTVRPGRHSCTLGSAMQRQLQHCGRCVHAVQKPGLVEVVASAFAPVHISDSHLHRVAKTAAGKASESGSSNKASRGSQGGVLFLTITKIEDL